MLKLFVILSIAFGSVFWAGVLSEALNPSGFLQNAALYIAILIVSILSILFCASLFRRFFP